MSLYDSATIGETSNQITFNDFDAEVVFRVRSRAPSRFQLREQDFPVPFQDGISDFLTLIGTTMYQITGTMYPSDEATYDTGVASLRALGSLDIAQEDGATGYVPYIWTEALRQKQLFVKVLYVDMSEDSRRGFVQPFTILCKIKDPTIYGATLKIASTADANPVTGVGSATHPFAYPIAYGATNYTSTSDATNVGTNRSIPTSIAIYGPITNPKITNATSGEFIQVNTTLSTVNDVLIIQYPKDSLTVTRNGVNVARSVTTDSTFFKIRPGTNNITLSGSSVGSGAYAEISYYDAWSLP